MGNYYSTQIEDILPPNANETNIDIESTELEFIEPTIEPPTEPTIEPVMMDPVVEPNFDPNEIFHPSAFDSPKRITDKQYAKVINYSKEHRYVRCEYCLYLTNFATFTISGRFTHPPRDTITVIKDEKTHDDIVCIDCKFCNNVIEVKI